MTKALANRKPIAMDTLPAGPLEYLLKYPWRLHVFVAQWSAHSEALWNIEKQSYQSDLPDLQSSKEDLREMVNDPDCDVLILFDGNDPAGYLSLVPLESELCCYDEETDPDDHWGDYDTVYVDNICLLPKYRGGRCFEFLLQVCVQYSLNNGYKRAIAHVRSSNGLAVFLRRKFGFRLLSTIENWGDCGEAFDYLELTPASVKNLYFFGSTAYRFLNAIRSLLCETRFEAIFRLLASKAAHIRRSLSRSEMK